METVVYLHYLWKQSCVCIIYGNSVFIMHQNYKARPEPDLWNQFATKSCSVCGNSSPQNVLFVEIILIYVNNSRVICCVL